MYSRRSIEIMDFLTSMSLKVGYVLLDFLKSAS